MIKRLKRLYRLSKLSDEVIDTVVEVEKEIPQGNGKAVFLSDVTDEEYDEMEMRDKSAVGVILKKLGL